MGRRAAGQSTRTLTRGPRVLLALATVVLAACDGGSEPAAGASTTPTVSNPIASPVGDGSPPSTGRAPATSVPTTADAEPTSPTASPSDVTTTAALTVPTTSAPDEWCALAAELHYLTTQFRQLDADDDDAVRQLLREILDRLAAIEPVSPPKLELDLPVSADAFRLLDTALAEVDYDIAAADLTALEAREAEIAEANIRIREYNREACGLDIGVTGTEPP